MKKILFILSLTLLICSGVAQAQEEEFGFEAQDWIFSISGSGTSDDDVDNTTLSAETEVGYFLYRWLAVGVRQGVGYADVDDGDDTWNGSTRGFADFHLDWGRFWPFAGVNFGYLYGDDVNDSWIAGPEVGIKIFLQERAYLSLLAEYNFTFDSAEDADEAFDDGRFVYALGIGVAF